MQFCRYCGGQISDDARFCCHCGKVVPAPPYQAVPPQAPPAAPYVPPYQAVPPQAPPAAPYVPPQQAVPPQAPPAAPYTPPQQVEPPQEAPAPYIDAAPQAQPRQSMPLGESDLARSRAILKSLSVRFKVNGIIWIVLAVVQIVLGCWLVVPLVALIGISNIISAIRDIKISNRILVERFDVETMFEPLWQSILTLVFNAVLGGVIGVLGSLYFLIFLRGYAMRNKDAFAVVQEDRIARAPKPVSLTENEVHITVTLTAAESAIGVEKPLFLEGMEKPVKIAFPPNVRQGDVMAVRRVAFHDPVKGAVPKDIYVRVDILP